MRFGSYSIAATLADIALIALEIHQADETAMPTTAMAYGHTSIGVAAAALAQRHEQRALGLGLGNFFEGINRSSRGYRGWSVFFTAITAPLQTSQGSVPQPG